MFDKKFMAIILLLLLFISKDAYAYIDPGIGSMMIQGVIGFLAAAVYILKIYWKKLINFFRKNKGEL